MTPNVCHPEAPIHVTASLARFSPGSFAMVMATGIVSLAAHFRGLEAIGLVLFGGNLAVYVVLWLLTLLRLLRYPARVLDDLRHPARSVTFLTKVAGSCVLGTQCAILTPWIGAAVMLWLVGIGLWLFLIYAFFAAVTIHQAKPTLDESVSGAWLLVTVSTESIAVLGCLVAPHLSCPDQVLFLCLAAFLIGATFYVVLVTLILHRWMFHALPADRMTPTYWINMGALAITSLAGSRLLLVSSPSPLLGDLAQFVKGLTLLSWALATWWIPLLLILGWWRHLWRRVPLTYDPQYWSLVFPLGMYTVATHLFARAAGLPFLEIIAQVFVWIALAAWTITFSGLACHLCRLFRWSGQPRPEGKHDSLPGGG